MKVTIVEKKNDCAMTIEELNDQRLVGFQTREPRKYHLVVVDSDKSCFVCADNRFTDPLDHMDNLAYHLLKGTFHVFDTAKELYLWMAE